MKLSKITTKQEKIVKLLYTYRYLDRTQIQTAVHHKDKRRVQAWLRDLRDKHYVEWIYATNFAEKTKPAIYYLGINGIRYLKTLEDYPIKEVRKRYKDNSRSRTFIDRCLAIAACSVALAATSSSCTALTEADYMNPDHEYHFLAEEDIIRPSLYIQKQADGAITNYLLEIFDVSLPRYRLRRRLKAYVTYLDDEAWPFDSQLIVLLVIPTLPELIYAKRATKKLIEDTYADADSLRIRFTTTDILKREGVMAKIWEQGRKTYSL